LFWNQLSYFKDHVNSSLIVEMKSKRYQFWKRSFENQAFWSKTQHTLFKIVLWLSCILKTEMTHCKFKMTFFMVLCIHFRLWFWGISFDGLWWGDLLWISRKTKGSSQNLRIHQERFFFLAPILSACIITNSLIHEATTLMEKLFKFWERHLSVQIAYLIKKGF
jgi:hypothetical protein